LDIGAASLIRRQPWLMAFIAACSVHLLVFTQLGLFGGALTRTPVIEKELSVTLNQEPSILETEKEDLTAIEQQVIEPPKELKTPIPQAETIIEATPTRITTDLIVTKPSSQVSDKLQLSLDSKAFRRFLKSETERNSKEAGESIANFKQTFEAAPRQEYAEELSPYHADSIQKGGNNDFALAQDGRVTCAVRTLNMLDVTASSNYVYKDCTPEKKFELNLNQPNNGWTNR